MKQLDNSLLMITSSSCLEIATSSLLVWNVTGLKVVVSSTTKTRPSLSGSTKKISSESSPCNKDLTSQLSSIVLPVESKPSKIPSTPPARESSCSTPSTDTSTPAQPTWEPVCVPQSTSPSQDGTRRESRPSKLAARNWESSPVVPEENLEVIS